MSALIGNVAELTLFVRQLVRLTTNRHKVTMVKIIGEEYRDFMSECFKNSESPYGQKWEPLKFRTSKGGSAQKPLLNTGLMRNACTYRNVTPNGFRVTVGRKYATTHQYGATIRAKNARALAFRGVEYVKNLKSGRTRRKYTDFIFRKKVVIPARPFAPLDGIPPRLSDQITEAISEYLQEYFEV